MATFALYRPLLSNWRSERVLKRGAEIEERNAQQGPISHKRNINSFMVIMVDVLGFSLQTTTISGA